jgi:hypothetical protein
MVRIIKTTYTIKNINCVRGKVVGQKKNTVELHCGKAVQFLKAQV